jgi:hypothetical protein
LVVRHDFPKCVDQFGELFGIIFFDNLATHIPDYIEFMDGQNFSPEPEARHILALYTCASMLQRRCISDIEAP